MHLNTFEAQHIVSPDFWRSLSNEEQYAAFILPLETLNRLPLGAADELAQSGNPVASAYVLRKHGAFQTPTPPTPVIPRQPNFWSGLHRDEEDE